jgi:fatty-acyl-CoA synthase
VRILDEHGAPVGPDVTGRVFVGGELTFEGYTSGAAKDVVDNMTGTGDMGYFDSSGRLFIVGREDDMIVSGGENVFPAEVEDCISAHPDVVEATAIGVEDKEWGHRLRAFVVKKDNADLDEDTVKKHVKDQLAKYKVPREVVFLDELPRNPTGKILKRELREIDVD